MLLIILAYSKHGFSSGIYIENDLLFTCNVTAIQLLFFFFQFKKKNCKVLGN